MSGSSFIIRLEAALRVIAGAALSPAIAHDHCKGLLEGCPFFIVFNSETVSFVPSLDSRSLVSTTPSVHTLFVPCSCGNGNTSSRPAK